MKGNIPSNYGVVVLGGSVTVLGVSVAVERFSGSEKNATISNIFATIIIKIPMMTMRVIAPMKYTSPVVLNKSTFVYSAMLL